MDEDILSLEKAAMERWRNGDPMGFVEISAENIIYVDPTLAKPITSLEEYRVYMKQVAGLIHYPGSEFIDPKIVRSGEIALLTYNYLSSMLTPEGTIYSPTPWNTTEVYARQEGAWKIVHSHWSYIRHRVPNNLEIPLPVRPAPTPYDGILGELMGLERVAMERWRKGDPSGFTELYAPDVTYFDTGTEQRVNGRKAMEKMYKLVEGKIFYEVMDFIDPMLIHIGDVGVLFYRFLSTHLQPDGSIKSRTPWNCTEVYQHMQGSWRIIHNHWSHIMGQRIQDPPVRDP